MDEPSALRPPKRVLILGCGYTGIRVARSLVALGIPIVATRRDLDVDIQRSPWPGVELHRLDALFPGDLKKLPTLVESCDAVVCSIPTQRVDGALVECVPAIVDTVRNYSLRFLYLSTTGVYGKQFSIDESSSPAPSTRRESLRVEAENAVLSTFPSSLVLRPAAIYGPGRGVHVSLREGRYRLTGDGSNYISRIHVEDLTAHVVAALDSDLKGAWPVADELPCTQREMAVYCATLLGLPMPLQAEPGSASETLRANRRVDGSAIRRRLGLPLRYPSYREGVPASIAEEERAASGNR